MNRVPKRISLLYNTYWSRKDYWRPNIFDRRIYVPEGKCAREYRHYKQVYNKQHEDN